jgi:hypothetical protein
MKSFKHILLALVSSLLLTVGLARAAESFDAVSTNPQMVQVQDGVPGINCTVIH